MTVLFRKATAVLLSLLVVAFGVYQIVMLFAFRGWLLPNQTCESLQAFAHSIPTWQKVLTYLLFISLPILYVYLLWLSQWRDRLIRVAPGTFIQESAVSGFLRGAVSDMKEIRSIRARCRMLRAGGMEVNCLVDLESRSQIDEIQGRLRAAVRACMAERLGLVPLADVLITVKRLEADAGAKEAARASSRILPTGPETAGGPPSRGTIDLSPVDLGEEIPAPEPDTEPMSRGGYPRDLTGELPEDEETRPGEPSQL
jgi:hypothetical protein